MLHNIKCRNGDISAVTFTELRLKSYFTCSVPYILLPVSVVSVYDCSCKYLHKIQSSSCRHFHFTSIAS